MFRVTFACTVVRLVSGAKDPHPLYFVLFCFVVFVSLLLFGFVFNFVVVVLFCCFNLPPMQF